MKIEAVRRFAMALQGVTEAPHHHFSSFRVGGKIFVTVPPDGLHIHAFVPELARERAVAMFPEFVEPLLWGGKVVGVRVALAAATPADVNTLVREAWALKAAAVTKKPARKAAPKPALKDR
jgi:hypothetical protein